jgi:hypothetical protein
MQVRMNASSLGTFGMAVGADHITFIYFLLYPAHGIGFHVAQDSGLFSSHMVKVHDIGWVLNTAIHAGFTFGLGDVICLVKVS